MSGETTTPPAAPERERVTNGLSRGAREIAEGTMRRVLAPIVLLVGLGGSAGALLHVLFAPESGRLWALVLHGCFVGLGLWWWRRPPLRIGAATIATSAYISIMIGSFSFTGASPSLQHFGVLAVGILYLILDRRQMLVAMGIWMVSVIASANFTGTAALAVSDVTICIVSFISGFGLRYARIRSIEELVELKASLERAIVDREQALARTIEQEKLASLGVMAAGVAHDYNNLLMGVVGGADLARAATSVEEREDAFAMISGSANALQALSRQLLDIAGGRPSVMSVIHFDRLVDECVAIERARAPTGVWLEVEHDAAMPPFEADEAGLRQLCLNLLRNAVQVSTLGDRIRVETFSDPHDPARVGLRLRDEGPGIPEDIRDRIFDPFFTTREDGRGLGLATVATVARRHGGTAALIDVDQGSCFEVRLRLKPMEAQVGIPTSSPEAESRNESGTVLVIDDEPASLQVTAKMLRHLGFETIEAASGDAALNRLSAASTDLIAALVDAHMPGMDGLETANALRTRLPDLPIIMISGYQSPEDAFGGPSDVEHGFIGKPFVRAQLERALRDARKRATTEA